MRKVKVWTLGDAVVDLLPLSGALLPAAGRAPDQCRCWCGDWESRAGLLVVLAMIASGRFMYQNY